MWLAPFFTPLPVLDSLVQKDPTQTLVIEMSCERGVQARTLQDQLFACICITQ